MQTLMLDGLGNIRTEEETESTVFRTLLRRKSTRAFDSSPVPSWKLERLFEAARWAPSSFNEQPWRYIVTTDDQPARRKKLLESLNETNRAWAKDAPVLILASAATVRTQNGQVNRHAVYDLGQSVANLSTEATALGLAVHQIGGFDVERVRLEFQIPEEVVPIVVIALGEPGDPLQLPGRFRDLEALARTRKPLTETVYFGSWNSRTIGELEPAETKKS